MITKYQLPNTNYQVNNEFNNSKFKIHLVFSLSSLVLNTGGAI